MLLADMRATGSADMNDAGSAPGGATILVDGRLRKEAALACGGENDLRWKPQVAKLRRRDTLPHLRHADNYGGDRRALQVRFLTRVILTMPAGSIHRELAMGPPQQTGTNSNHRGCCDEKDEQER